MNVFMEPIVKLYFFLMILISFCGKYVHLESSILVWPVPLAHYKIGKLNIASLMGFLIMFFFGYELEVYLGRVCINVLNSQIWKEIMLELNGKPSSVTASSTDFSFQKPGFLEFIWIFSGKNHLKINNSHILNPNLTK